MNDELVALFNQPCSVNPPSIPGVSARHNGDRCLKISTVYSPVWRPQNKFLLITLYCYSPNIFQWYSIFTELGVRKLRQIFKASRRKKSYPVCIVICMTWQELLLAKPWLSARILKLQKHKIQKWLLFTESLRLKA